MPTAPVPRPSAPVAPTPPPTTVATLRRTAADDPAWQELVAANARYAQQAQARIAQEAAQAKELARVQKQMAARAAAQKRLSIAQAAAAAKATAAARLGLPADSTNTEAGAATETAVASLGPVPPLVPASPAVRESKRRSVSAVVAARQAEVKAALAAKAASFAATAPEKAETDVEEVAPARRPARPVASAAPTETRAARAQPDPRPAKEEAATATLYTVRPGDNLTRLAREQGLSLEQLKAWNKLTGETVMVGQQLRLTAPTDATATPMAAAPATARRAKTEVKTLPDSPKLATHVVQPGDTLFSIARRFGLSLEELKRLNHLASDQVKLGQKLVVGG
jgi:membrane-bound lytic murein transglycosylase D